MSELTLIAFQSPPLRRQAQQMDQDLAACRRESSREAKKRVPGLSREQIENGRHRKLTDN